MLYYNLYKYELVEDKNTYVWYPVNVQNADVSHNITDTSDAVY